MNCSVNSVLGILYFYIYFFKNYLSIFLILNDPNIIAQFEQYFHSLL